MAQETKRDRYIWYAKQSGAIKVMSIAYQMYLSLLGWCNLYSPLLLHLQRQG